VTPVFVCFPLHNLFGVEICFLPPQGCGNTSGIVWYLLCSSSDPWPSFGPAVKIPVLSGLSFSPSYALMAPRATRSPTYFVGLIDRSSTAFLSPLTFSVLPPFFSLPYSSPSFFFSPYSGTFTVLTASSMLAAKGVVGIFTQPSSVCPLYPFF